MLACIVEDKKAVAINATAKIIVHAKKVSIDVDGKTYFSI